MANCTPTAQLSSKVKKRSIDINFQGGDVSGNGGVVLLKEVDERLGLLDAVSGVLNEPRDPNRITHTLTSFGHNLLICCQISFSGGSTKLYMPRSVPASSHSGHRPATNRAAYAPT